MAELLDEYLRHQGGRGTAPKTLLEARRRADDIEADEIGGKDIRRQTGRDLDEFYAKLAAAGGRSGRGRHPDTRGEAVAHLLGLKPVIFPGDHGGFAAYAWSADNDPAAFAAKLREVLSEDSPGLSPLVPG